MFRNKFTKKAVYSVTIDFHSSRENARESDNLKKHKEYYLNNNNRKLQEGTSYSEIQEFVVNVINNELKPICENYSEIPIRSIKVQNTFEGSIIVFFSVVFNILQGISAAKDLYDIIKLINNITEKHIKARLDEKYGDFFRVDSSNIYPDYRSREYCDEFYLMHKEARRRGYPLIFNDSMSKRDVFFYYLLISNIILFIILGFLVFKAVATMYW